MSHVPRPDGASCLGNAAVVFRKHCNGILDNPHVSVPAEDPLGQILGSEALDRLEWSSMSKTSPGADRIEDMMQIQYDYKVLSM